MRKLNFLLLIVVVSFVQCKNIDFGNTNKNDASVETPVTEGLMASAMAGFARLGGRDYLLNPSNYVQYQSQYIYTDESLYNDVPSNWATYYIQKLSNLKKVYEMTTGSNISDITPLFGAPENQAAVAELMSVLIWKRITDNFGPIPYTESLGDGSITPSYDDQEVIYKDLVARTKAARDMINTSATGPTGDVIYGGNMTKWQKFANSLILHLTAQLSKVYPGASEYAATEFKAALSNSKGVIENYADEFWYRYENKPGATNPYQDARDADYDLSEGFVNALQGNASTAFMKNDPTKLSIGYTSTTADPRLAVFTSTPNLPGRPYGVAINSSDNASYAKLDKTTIGSSTAGMPFLTAAMVYLYRAEAANLGWTTENVKTNVQNAIEKSYASLESMYGKTLDAGDKAAYVTARLNDIDNFPAKTVIAEEKWVAAFPNTNLAWAEWRKTDIPVLTPAPDAVNGGVIPRRYVYPADEGGINPVNYDAGVQKLTPATDSNKSRVWWDKP